MLLELLLEYLVDGEVGDVEARPAGDDSDQEEDHGDERILRRVFCDVLEGRIKRIVDQLINCGHNLHISGVHRLFESFIINSVHASSCPAGWR